MLHVRTRPMTNAWLSEVPPSCPLRPDAQRFLGLNVALVSDLHQLCKARVLWPWKQAMSKNPLTPASCVSARPLRIAPSVGAPAPTGDVEEALVTTRQARQTRPTFNHRKPFPRNLLGDGYFRIFGRLRGTPAPCGKDARAGPAGAEKPDAD